MHFDLVDAVLEQTDDSIVTIKHVSGAEEYLQDHFAGFPVLPGVMMLEAMVQAGRRLAEHRRAPSDPPLVLGTVRGLKYGRFVPPGCSLVVRATAGAPNADGTVDVKATAEVREADGSMSDQKAATGRLTLRPLRATPEPSPSGV
jgi:3-hydroxyacyl-[acyl-carrier-protein] dehydratase